MRIEGRLGVQASIAFAEDEHIENVAIGDSATWQITPNKRANLLFVKPLAANARTNMTVVTDKRTYLFDLVASPRNSALYVLQFRYPELEKAAEEARLAAIAEAEAVITMLPNGAILRAVADQVIPAMPQTIFLPAAVDRYVSACSLRQHTEQGVAATAEAAKKEAKV